MYTDIDCINLEGGELIGEVMRIKVCEFRARNIRENKMTYIEVEKEKGRYFYINYKGERSFEYNSIEEAKEDIKNLYGRYKDFSLLI